MASYIFPPIGENDDYNEAVREMKSDYGSDAFDFYRHEYSMELYPEIAPTFNSWVFMDESRERIKEFTENDEKIWRD